MLASLPVLEHHISPTLLLTGGTRAFVFPLTSWDMLEPFTSPSFPTQSCKGEPKKRHFEDAKEMGGRGKKLFVTFSTLLYLPKSPSLFCPPRPAPPTNLASLVAQLIKNSPAM